MPSDGIKYWKPMEFLSPLSGTPVKKDEKKLEDYVVTMEKQKALMLSGSKAMSVQKIAEDQNVRNMFPKPEFPEFEVMNGGIFFDPTLRVASVVSTYYVKWFSLSKDFRISHDHDYPYVRVIPNGYLMKLKITKGNIGIHELNIEYVVPVEGIPISYINGVTGLDTERTLDKAYAVNEDVNYVVRAFDSHEYPQVLDLISDTESFSNTYLQDILALP